MRSEAARQEEPTGKVTGKVTARTTSNSWWLEKDKTERPISVKHLDLTISVGDRVRERGRNGGSERKSNGEKEEEKELERTRKKVIELI